VRGSVDAEFVVAAVEVLHRRESADDDLGVAVRCVTRAWGSQHVDDLSMLVNDPIHIAAKIAVVPPPNT